MGDAVGPQLLTPTTLHRALTYFSVTYLSMSRHGNLSRSCLVVVQTPIDNMAKHTNGTPSLKSKLRSVLRSGTSGRIRVAILRAVVYYARAAHAFSIGIISRIVQCRHLIPSLNEWADRA